MKALAVWRAALVFAPKGMIDSATLDPVMSTSRYAELEDLCAPGRHWQPFVLRAESAIRIRATPFSMSRSVFGRASGLSGNIRRYGASDAWSALPSVPYPNGHYALCRRFRLGAFMVTGVGKLCGPNWRFSVPGPAL